jgi:hypothetical protein
MILGITLEESIKLIKKSGCTSTKDLVAALKLPLGTKLTRFKTKIGVQYEGVDFPCILKVCWNDGRSHWVVYKGKKIYDPAAGVYKVERYQDRIKGLGKITSYLQVR